MARRTANDQYVGINAGSSSHSGLEFLVNYALLALPQLQITPYFSGAVNAFKFKEFLDGDADYSGNQLTGVPENQFNFGVDLNTKNGFTVNTSFRTMGAIPLNDSNTKYSERYALLDIKTTYVFTILSVLKTELNAGINNASNTKYAANILPNAVGFGTAAPRYFYPGNPVNWYGGFSVTYFFLDRISSPNFYFFNRSHFFFGNNFCLFVAPRSHNIIHHISNFLIRKSHGRHAVVVFD